MPLLRQVSAVAEVDQRPMKRLRTAMFLVAGAIAAGASSSMVSAEAVNSGFRIGADTVTSGNNPGLQGIPCVNQTVFFPGDVIVFRAVVADGVTGAPLTEADVASRGIEVTVTTSESRPVQLKLGFHPPPQTQAPKRLSYWTGSMAIPKTHPTGTLPWTITVSDKQGLKTTYSPIGQEAGISVLTIATPKS
jgi:hypothetical protein